MCRFVEKAGQKELAPYVFHDLNTLKAYASVRRSFATALNRAGITDFTFHSLRHTFASQLVMAGVDLTTVKELLGHKDIKMALRYAHLAPAHKRKAVNVLDSLLNPAPNCTPTTNCTITAQEIKSQHFLLTL
jgi:integrase